jgi:hypothetical protein
MGKKHRFDNPGNFQPPVVLSIGQQTREAVATLLAIADKIGPYCVTAADTGSIPGTGERTMKEAADSAETTFMKVCAALDDIISDKGRWTKDDEKELKDALARLHNERATNAAAHTAAMQQATRPSVLLRPLLVQLRSGLWVCASGTEDGALQGTGRSPEEAQKDFDVNYYKMQVESVEEMLAQQKIIVQQHQQQQQPQPKSRKRKNTSNE